MRRIRFLPLICAVLLQCLLPLFGVAHAASHLGATQAAAVHGGCHEHQPAKAHGKALHDCCAEGRCHCAGACGASALPLTLAPDPHAIGHEPAVSSLRTALASAHRFDRLRPPISLLPA